MKKIILIITLVLLLAVSLCTPALALSNGQTSRRLALTYLPSYVNFRNSNGYYTDLELPSTVTPPQGSQADYEYSSSGNTYYSSAYVRTTFSDDVATFDLYHTGVAPQLNDTGSGYPLGRPYGNRLDPLPLSGGYPLRSSYVTAYYTHRPVAYVLDGDTVRTPSSSTASSFTHDPITIQWYIPYSRTDSVDSVRSTLNSYTFTYTYTIEYLTLDGTYSTTSLRPAGSVTSIVFSDYDYFADPSIGTAVVTVVYDPTPVINHVLTLETLQYSEIADPSDPFRVTTFLSESFAPSVPAGNALGVPNTGGSGFKMYFVSRTTTPDAFSAMGKSFVGVDNRVSLEDVNLVDWLGNTVGYLFDAPILGFVTLGALVTIALSIGVTFLILKVFAGG